MNIRRQLQFLIAIAFLGLLTIIGSGLYGLHKMEQFLEHSQTEALFYQNSVDTGRMAQVEFQRQVQEWKNILIRGNDPALYVKYLAQFQEKGVAMDAKLAKLSKDLAAKGEKVEAINELLGAHRSLQTQYLTALNTWDPSDGETGKKVDLLLRGIDRPTSKSMDTLATALQEEAERDMLKIKQDAASSITAMTRLIIGVSIAALMVLMLVSTVIYKKIITILGAEPEYLVTIFKMLSKGDFTVPITIREGDKTSLTANIALMQRKMKNMVMAIKNGTGELEALTQVMESTDTAMSPRKFAEVTTKAVEGLNEAVSRFIVSRDA